jgi:transcriptional regulator with XRE-family HTH domain
MSIVERIQRLCDENNITVGILEKNLGLSKAAIYKWHKSSPNSDTLLKVARYFGVPMESLLADSFTVEDFGKDDAALREFIKSKENKPYIIMSAKAKEKGMSPETLEKLIELYTK